MRLFIAINFNQEIKDKLNAHKEMLRARSNSGSFTMSNNLHITLAFLGECTQEQAAAAKAAMDKVRFEPFDIEIDSIGRFKRNDGDIWWAGVKENTQLESLQQKLSNSLQDLGFKLEKRKFSPHITLGRKVKTDISSQKIKPFGQRAYKIHLMKSERIDGVLTYTSIYMKGKRPGGIIVEPYNPQWPYEFDRLKAFLMPHIGHLIIDIHHIGSTSVPGLAAKSIIDFDIEIPSMEVFPAIKAKLAPLGYRHQGDYGISGREVFMCEIPEDFMEYHMYVCPSDSAELMRHIKFRDYLRGNPTAVAEYGELKTQLAKKHADDIDAYIDDKAGFILSALLN